MIPQHQYNYVHPQAMMPSYQGQVYGGYPGAQPMPAAHQGYYMMGQQHQMAYMGGYPPQQYMAMGHPQQQQQYDPLSVQEFH